MLPFLFLFSLKLVLISAVTKLCPLKYRVSTEKKNDNSLSECSTWAQRPVLTECLFCHGQELPSASLNLTSEGLAHDLHDTNLDSIYLTLKLLGEDQMALPLNLNDKNIPNADFFLVF